MTNIKTKIITILSTITLVASLGIFTGCSTGAGNISAGNEGITNQQVSGNLPYASKEEALKALDQIQIADQELNGPKYDREKYFGNGWKYDKATKTNTRTKVLQAQGQDIKMDDKNKVMAGRWYIQYTGQEIVCNEKNEVSKLQIDHICALSWCWKSGAQQLTQEQREALANDVEDNLCVCDSHTNISKSDKSIVDYQPSNKSYQLTYAEKWIKVCNKYSLHLTQLEYNTIKNIINNN